MEAADGKDFAIFVGRRAVKILEENYYAGNDRKFKRVLGRFKTI